jgi:hypothetical protein
MAGRPAASLEGARGPGSASILHAISRAVSVSCLAVVRNLAPAFFFFFHFRRRMHASPDTLLTGRPGLHYTPRCRGRFLSLRRVCCSPLHVRIRSVARQYPLYLYSSAHLSAPRCRARGRRRAHASDALQTRAPATSEELIVNCWR